MKSIDLKRFCVLLSEVDDKEQTTVSKRNALNIINTIDGYYDCMGEFVNELCLDDIYEAISLLSESREHELLCENRAESALEILSSIRNIKKKESQDLF